MAYDIIIVAGQSNAEGMGLGTIENGYQPNDKVYYLTAEKTVAHTPERVIVNYADKGFDIAVAEERKVNNVAISDFSFFVKKSCR